MLDKILLSIALIITNFYVHAAQTLPEVLMIDDFVYKDGVNLDSIWVPRQHDGAVLVNPSAEVETIINGQTVRSLKMPCDYSIIPENKRCYWDKSVDLDLSDYDSIIVRFYVSDTSPIHSYTLFFKSGPDNNWYKYSVNPATWLNNNWNTLVIPKSSFAEEGNPTGWHDITAIRLSPWKKDGAIESNFIAYHSLLASVDNAFAIDDFVYSDTAEVLTVWEKKGAYSPDVSMETSGIWGNEQVIKMDCDYSIMPNDNRCFWDRYVNYDLTFYNTVAIRLYVSNPDPINHLTFYVETNNGWFSSAPKLNEGWQTIILPLHKLDSSGAGDPDNYSNIRRIRISPWKKDNVNQQAFLAIDYIKVFNKPIAIIDGTSNWFESVEVSLDYYDLDYYEVSVSDIESGTLNGSQLFINVNADLSDAALAKVEDYVSAGGYVFGIGENVLFDLTSGDSSNYLGVTRDINIDGISVTGMELADSVITHLPSQMPEYDNFTFTRALPDTEANDPARVIGYWQNETGTTTNNIAWLANSNGVFIDNGLTANSYHRDAQAYLLGAFVSHYLPSLLPKMHITALDHLNSVGEYTSYADAINNIQSINPNQQAQIDSFLVSAQTHYSNAQSNIDKFGILEARKARLDLQAAYALSKEPSQQSEVRALWMLGLGPYPGDWVKTMDLVKDSGFNTVLINSIKSGITSFYPSDYLEPNKDWNPIYHGDNPLADAIDEAHQRGISVEAWVQTWSAEHAPNAVLDQMKIDFGLKTQMRTTSSFALEEVKWLNPCDQTTADFRFDSIYELMDEYNINGLHLDFIRFRGDSSYDDICKTRFQSETGIIVAQWPQDVYQSGVHALEYQDWRASLITDFIDRVYQAAQAINNEQRPNKPEIKISAAVFNHGHEMAQYWDEWVMTGIVDHVYPLVYSDNLEEFKTLINDSFAFINGANIPLYPGIGAWLNTSDGVIAQIDWTRNRPQGNTNGFALFAMLQDMAENLLPDLPLGITKPNPYSLLISTSPDRSNAQLLINETVAGNIYVFTHPNLDEINSVSFYLDDPDMNSVPKQQEYIVPYDFAGTHHGIPERPAIPYNTTQLTNGMHSITAKISFDNGSETVLTATFEVAN